MKFGKHSSIIVREETPFNAEPPLGLLRETLITPKELFFVRNHGSVPDIDPRHYRLRVTGMVRRPLTLSLSEICGEFSRRTLAAALQCAGNRRQELHAIAPISGEVPWNAGAIGNAQWTGVPLKEILLAAKIETEAKHIAFTGLDKVECGGSVIEYGCSVPAAKAMSGEVLLAYGMNGEPLAPVHGFPLRALVCGCIGARSVKWLGEITALPQPSGNHFQSHAYKIFPPEVRVEDADWATGLTLSDLPVNAVIASPAEGGTLRAGRNRVQGYAVSGGRSIERVDLSCDQGNTWVTAKLLGEPDPWSWRFWEAELQLVPGRVQLSARAWDSAAQTQPEDPRKIWNFKGYVNNAWHRVEVAVDCQGGLADSVPDP